MVVPVVAAAARGAVSAGARKAAASETQAAAKVRVGMSQDIERMRHLQKDATRTADVGRETLSKGHIPERPADFMGGRFGQAKRAAKLAFQHRKAIESGDFTPFIPALAMALAKDGLLDFIPIVGNLLGVFITVYLFIFLWGRGKWKVRLVVFFLSLFDVIPGVNFVPLSTISVIYAYLQAKKEAEERGPELASLEEQSNAERIRIYQMMQASQAAADEAAAQAAAAPSQKESASERKIV